MILRQFNWLDWILIAILLWGVWRSFRRGFTREIVGLAAALLALLCGMWFYGDAGLLFVRYTGEGNAANLAGFIAVVAVVLIAGAIAGWIASRFIRAVGLSFFDRVLGAVFGLARGLLVAIALLSAFVAFGPAISSVSTSKAVVNSLLAPHILEASKFFVAAAPMELKQAFRKEYANMQAVWRKARTPNGG